MRVRDNGVGIPPRAARRRSSRCSPRSTARCDRAQGGLGIGLSLVRQPGRAARRHGRPRDSDGRRARAARSSCACRSPAAELPRRAAGRPTRRRGRPTRVLQVLVVDDNADAADSLAALLRARRARGPRSAHDGAGGAASAAQRSRRTSCCCDIGMPGMDGHEVARAPARATGHDVDAAGRPDRLGQRRRQAARSARRASTCTSPSRSPRSSCSPSSPGPDRPRDASLLADQPVADRVDRQLGVVGQRQLLEHARPVDADRLRATA